MRFISLHGLFKEVFFGKMLYSNMFVLTRYYYPQKNLVFGFFKKEVYTAYIDISVESSIFFSYFKKNTRYEVMRAKRESILFEEEKNVKIFYDYYNEFAKSKNLELLTYSTLLKYNKYLVITKAVKNEVILSMHVHIYEDDIVLLLYSASQFRSMKDNKSKNIIGYANRFLHYNDMCYFKNKGCLVYDFGGYAYNTTIEEEQKINYFKDSFSCIPIQRYIYTSWMLSIFIFIKNIFEKFGLKMRKL